MRWWVASLALIMLFAGCQLGFPSTTLKLDDPAPPFSALHFDPDLSTTGTVQHLQVTLDVASDRSLLLALSIRYSNGEQQRVLKTVTGTEATLEWTVPDAAGTGTATFRLTAQDCGCGHSGARSQTWVEKTITGSFLVQ